MSSMTKSRDVDEMQTPFYFVNRRQYEDVKFYRKNIHTPQEFAIFFLIPMETANISGILLLTCCRGEVFNLGLTC